MLICCSCVQFLVTLWTVAHQAPLSMGFSRQEHWSCCVLLQGSSRPRDQIHVSYVSCIGRRVIASVTWEAPLSLSFLKYKIKILWVSVLMCQ